MAQFRQGDQMSGVMLHYGGRYFYTSGFTFAADYSGQGGPMDYYGG